MTEKQPNTKMIHADVQEEDQGELEVLVEREVLQVQRIEALKRDNGVEAMPSGECDCSPANSPRPKVKVPDHRDVVAKWMNEAVLFGLDLADPEGNVTDNKSVAPRLFTLAASLMDMFLLKCKIKLTQLQLVGSACLSLAAKTRKIQLSEDALIECSDYALTGEEIQVCTLKTACTIILYMVCIFWCVTFATLD